MQASEIMAQKNWAVIGDVGNEVKYANKILKELQVHGYQAVGVHPRGGEGIQKRLSQSATPIDIIDLCINPKAGFEYIQEAARLGIDKVLIQPGAESAEILTYCAQQGIDAVEGCALVLLAYRRESPKKMI